MRSLWFQLRCCIHVMRTQTSCTHCFHWTMHVILFVCGFFHTHSLSTGWCLWRSWLEVRFEFLFIVFIPFWMSISAPLPLSPRFQLISVGSITANIDLLSLLVFLVLLFVTQHTAASSFPSHPSGMAAVEFFSSFAPLFSLYTFPAKCSVLYVPPQWFVVDVSPRVCSGSGGNRPSSN